MNSKINAAETDIDYLNEHAFGLTKFFDGLLDSASWETVSSDGDNLLVYTGVIGLSFANEFTPIQDGLANPNYKLRAKLILNDAILTWMQENKIPKLLLMQEKATAEFALAWPGETTSFPPTPIGITVDVLKDNALHYETFECDATYYVIDAAGGGGAGSGVFYAECDVTGYDEIEKAYESGMGIMARQGGVVMPLTRYDGLSFEFSSHTNDSKRYCRCTLTGWTGNASYAIETQTYKDIQTPVAADVGYIRPIRVSTLQPTNDDGNVGDVWIVIGG